MPYRSKEEPEVDEQQMMDDITRWSKRRGNGLIPSVVELAEIAYKALMESPPYCHAARDFNELPLMVRHSWCHVACKLFDTILIPLSIEAFRSVGRA